MKLYPALGAASFGKVAAAGFFLLLFWQSRSGSSSAPASPAVPKALPPPVCRFRFDNDKLTLNGVEVTLEEAVQACQAISGTSAQIACYPKPSPGVLGQIQSALGGAGIPTAISLACSPEVVYQAPASGAATLDVTSTAKMSQEDVDKATTLEQMPNGCTVRTFDAQHQVEIWKSLRYQRAYVQKGPNGQPDPLFVIIAPDASGAAIAPEETAEQYLMDQQMAGQGRGQAILAMVHLAFDSAAKRYIRIADPCVFAQSDGMYAVLSAGPEDTRRVEAAANAEPVLVLPEGE